MVIFWVENEEIKNFSFPLKRPRTEVSYAHIRAEIPNFKEKPSKPILTKISTFLGFGPTYIIFTDFGYGHIMGGK